jgi:D-alanyl-lipoteichoic acid acyltransferase DltB (MBOAT superfamily)
VAVADTLAPLVDVRFQFPWLVSGSDLVWALYLFSIQIYCDFSGYSDIARGVSRLFGIDLALNFRQPYFATSIADFWRRWHISLSTWFRDYLFPGSSQRTKRSRWMRPVNVRRVRHVRRVLVTFLVSGLWHGASWVFVAWGGLHGIYVSLQSLVSDARVGARIATVGAEPSRLKALLAMVATFHLVTFTWLFFRAGSLVGAWNYLAALGRWQPAGSIAPLNILGVRLPLLLMTLAAGEILQERTRSQTPILEWSWLPQGLAYAYLAVAILVLGNPSGDVPFIYFQF